MKAGLPSAQDRSGAFGTTQWGVVSSAIGGDVPGAEVALEQLCAQYWYPIYAFIRRRGFGFHEAEDLTQTFFGHLLAKERLQRVDRQKGKFRTFLLAALTNFLNNEWDKKRTWKRGGRGRILSLDETTAEKRYRHEPVEWVTPESLFERRWAFTLLEQVLARLKREHVAAGKAEWFAKLEPYITGELTPGAYGALAWYLGMKEEAVRVALSRTRRRFGQLLRSEIARTVTDPAEVDDEIRQLFAAVAYER